MKQLSQILEHLFDTDSEEIMELVDGNEIFPGIIIHIDKNGGISLHLKKVKVYISGSLWKYFLRLLKTKKIKSVTLETDLDGYHGGSGLYINLDDCGVLDGMKILIQAKTSLYLIKKKGKCIIKNFYIDEDNDSYDSLIFDVKNSDSLSFEDCYLCTYYGECSVEKLPNIKNTETDFAQLRIITSKNILGKYKYLSKTAMDNLVKRDILNNWKLFNLGSIQVFVDNIKDRADAIFYKMGYGWSYHKN